MLRTTFSHSIPDPRPIETDDYHDVLSIVRQAEWLEMFIPRAIMSIFIGLPILLGFLHGHPILGLLNAFLLLFVGAFLCRVVAMLVLAPLHAVRYVRVMRTLSATLSKLAPDAILTAQWMAGAPGALAITRLDTVLLVDRSTGYRFIALADEEIVAVDRKVDEDVQVTTRQRPAFTLGMTAGRSFLGGWTFGGLTVTDARVARLYTVVLRYQREDDPAIRCALIPFGADELGAENLRIALDRVRKATSF
jgi:hypothetical protein